MLRHIPLIHTMGNLLSLRLWLRMEPELGMKKYCRLVDIFYNYNLTAGAYWHLQFTRHKGLLMIAAISKRPTVGITDINSKHNRLSRSQFQRSIFLTPFKEKRKKKLLNGHGTRCSASLFITRGIPIKTRNQIPSEKMVILTVCKQ